MQPTPPLLTVAEVAVRMNMPEHMVRRRIRQKKLKAINISHPNRPEYRVSEASIARFERDYSTAA